MRLTSLFLCIALLAGCGSMLSIGHEDFACQGDGEGGQCTDPMSVAKNKDEIIKEWDKNKEKKSGKGAAEKDEGQKKTTVITAQLGKPSLETGPVPVRKTEQVQRIYIIPFTDASRNRIGGIWLHTVVKDGEWVPEDGE